MRKAFELIHNQLFSIILMALLLGCDTSPSKNQLDSTVDSRISGANNYEVLDNTKSSNQTEMQIKWNRFPDLFMGISVTYLEGETQISEIVSNQKQTKTYEIGDKNWNLTHWIGQDGKIIRLREEFNGNVSELEFKYTGLRGEGRDASGKLHKIEYDDNGRLLSWEKLDDSSPSKTFSISFFKNDYDKLGRLSGQIRYESDGMQSPVYYAKASYKDDTPIWTQRVVQKQTILFDVEDWELMELPADILSFPSGFEKTAIKFEETRTISD
jgi:YD repeat-containing protein